MPESSREGSRGSTIVAGGAGFIGSNLCERLLAAGETVVCIDNLQTGRMENIAHLAAHPRFSFRQHDVIAPLEAEAPVSRIYNLACAASPGHYQRDPLHTFKSSIWGAMNLLDLARETGARILQASTSEAYGDPTVSPQHESYHGNVNTTGPRACYDESKRAAETLFYEMHRRGVDTRIARIFNTYGPRMAADDGRVISTFVTQALSGAPLTINGDGQQTRSFCYIDDMLDGLIALMETETAGPQPVNLGNPEEMTVREVAALVLEATGTDLPLTRRPLPQDDPMQRRPDISRAGALLGWEPRVSLRDGLVPTIAWFEEELFGHDRNVVDPAFRPAPAARAR